MKHLLNTLFITTQGSYLSREGETVLVRQEQETKLRVPIHTLGGIICFGQVSCSPPLMELCGQRGVMISFLSERGRFFARVQGAVSGNVLLRRQQYRLADDEIETSRLARSFILGKIANCRIVLQRGAREHDIPESADALRTAATRLGHLLDRINRPLPLDQARGCEGEAADVYFSVFDHLIVASKADFFLHGRNRRPPLDNMNSLLSFLYTLLAHDTAAALESVGLDPAVGFLHRDRPGRPGLALDLMEEFRPLLADRLALTLVNRQQVSPSGFTRTESGAILMDDATRREVLISWQKRKQEEILHPFLNERLAIGLIPYAQALLLARHLRGDMQEYPPFFWK